MSFALTTAQVRARTKTVTRRVGWTFLKPGDLIRAVVKCQGLKKGEKVEPLAVLRVVDVRREPLRRLIDDCGYGFAELVREGFDLQQPTPGTHEDWYYPHTFVEQFCATHAVPAGQFDAFRNRVRMRRCTLDDKVTRIAFEYVDDEAPFVTPTLDECRAFLREKLAATEEHIRAREDGARVYRTATTAEWRAAGQLHPSTRGKRTPTKRERLKSAEIEERIADKLWREAELYRATLAALGASSEEAADDVR